MSSASGAFGTAGSRSARLPPGLDAPQPERATTTTVPTIRMSPGSNLSASAGNETRSEEHTSELQSQSNLVCRLLLEKKKTKTQRDRCTTQTTHAAPTAAPLQV